MVFQIISLVLLCGIEFGGLSYATPIWKWDGVTLEVLEEFPFEDRTISKSPSQEEGSGDRGFKVHQATEKNESTSQYELHLPDSQPGGPNFVGEGEECNGSLPPQYATLCDSTKNLECVHEDMCAGCSGICKHKQTPVPTDMDVAKGKKGDHRTALIEKIRPHPKSFLDKLRKGAKIVVHRTYDWFGEKINMIKERFQDDSDRNDPDINHPTIDDDYDSYRVPDHDDKMHPGNSADDSSQLQNITTSSTTPNKDHSTYNRFKSSTPSATRTPTSIPNRDDSNLPSTETKRAHSHLSVEAIVSIAVGSIFAVVALLVLFIRKNSFLKYKLSVNSGDIDNYDFGF